MARFKLSDSDIEYIQTNCMLYSNDELADYFGVSKSTIARALKRNGISKVYTREEEKFIVEFHKEYTLEELTYELNKNFHNGLPVRKKGGVREKIIKNGLVRKVEIGEEVIFNGSRSKYTYIRLGSGQFVNKSVKVYQKAFGDIPEGHKIIHMDGDNSNFEPSNLMAVDNVAFGTYFGMKSRVDNNDTDLNKCLWMIAQLNSLIKEGELNDCKK